MDQLRGRLKFVPATSPDNSVAPTKNAALRNVAYEQPRPLAFEASEASAAARDSFKMVIARGDLAPLAPPGSELRNRCVTLTKLVGAELRRNPQANSDVAEHYDDSIRQVLNTLGLSDPQIESALQGDKRAGNEPRGADGSFILPAKKLFEENTSRLEKLCLLMNHAIGMTPEEIEHGVLPRPPSGARAQISWDADAPVRKTPRPPPVPRTPSAAGRAQQAAQPAAAQPALLKVPTPPKMPRTNRGALAAQPQVDRKVPRPPAGVRPTTQPQPPSTAYPYELRAGQILKPVGFRQPGDGFTLISDLPPHARAEPLAVALDGPKVPHLYFMNLPKYAPVASLRLNDCPKISNNHFVSLGEHSGLRQLAVSDCLHITEKGIAFLEDTSIKELTLRNTGVTDLGKCKLPESLRQLTLEGNVSLASLKGLEKARKLETVTLKDFYIDSSTSLPALLSLANLKELNLSGCSMMPATLGALKSVPGLKVTITD